MIDSSKLEYLRILLLKMFETLYKSVSTSYAKQVGKFNIIISHRDIRVISISFHTPRIFINDWYKVKWHTKDDCSFILRSYSINRINIEISELRNRKLDKFVNIAIEMISNAFKELTDGC